MNYTSLLYLDIFICDNYNNLYYYIRLATPDYYVYINIHSHINTKYIHN